MLVSAATPLSIVLWIAFVLLLLSTLSTPIIKSVYLASDRGWNFGVLGYCDTNGNNCIKPHIGYSTSTLLPGSDFSLGGSTRNTLSEILIVHPVAALLTLICAILATAAHFHAPASSARFLLALLLLTIPTLLVTLLAFLVDILLFVPRLGWGGWIVLGATILIMASSILTCAMRRTLISRKARTKRIAENDDMNGVNYYNNLNEQRMMADEMPRADSPPPMDKTGAQYSTFETKSHEGASRTSDDRTPLNPPMRDPSIRSAGSGARRYENGPVPPMPAYDDGRSGSPARRPSRDEYGNPYPASMDRRPSRDEYGNPYPPGMEPPMLRPSGSRGSLNSNGSQRGMPYGRGRGYPSQRGYDSQRGGYGGPRGDFGSRGNFAPRGYRGGPRGGYRGGPPPPGWNGRGGYAPRGGYGRPSQDDYRPNNGQYGANDSQYAPRSQSPEGYAVDPYYTSTDSPHDDHRPPPAFDDQFVARGVSPGGAAIGQAIEMNERTGSPPTYQQGYGYQQGFGGQERHQSPQRKMSNHSGDRGDYENNAYSAPRTNWRPVAPPNAPSRFSPDNTSSKYSSGRAIPLSPIQASPNPGHARSGSENYYEDVDPRFAVDEPNSEQYQSIIQEHQHPAAVPSSLMPGNAFAAAQRMATPPQDTSLLQPPPSRFHSSSNRQPSTDRTNSNSSIDEQKEGTRSPDGSENSHFTSISQRPVNPHWRPGYSGGGSGSSAVAAQRRKEDIILNGNPDFSIPGAGVGRGRGRAGTVVGPAAGLTPPGRYPTEI